MKRMKKSTGVVIFIIFLAIIVSLGYYAFTILKSTGIGKDRNLKLGLDLAGGVSITYGVVGDTTSGKRQRLLKQMYIRSDLTG